MIFTIVSIFMYACACVVAISNKKTRVLPFVILICLGVIFSFRDPHEADTEAYYAVFNALKSYTPSQLGTTFGITKGFLYIMYLFAKIGFSFQAFRFLLFLVSVVLIYKGIRGITYNYLLLICLYAFFPFGYDIDQIRQFLVNAIVMFAFQYIIKDKVEKIDIVKYTILILLSTVFHLSAPFYLLYLLILLKREDFYKFIVIICSVIFAVTMIIGPGFFITTVANLFHINKLLSYTYTLAGYHMNPLLSVFELLLVLYFVWNSNRCKDVNFGYNDIGRKVWKISCITCLILPALTFSLMFERLLRPIIILNYSQTGNAIYHKNISKSSRLNLLFALILVLALRSMISIDYVTKMFSNLLF